MISAPWHYWTKNLTVLRYELTSRDNTNWEWFIS